MHNDGRQFTIQLWSMLVRRKLGFGHQFHKPRRRRFPDLNIVRQLTTQKFVQNHTQAVHVRGWPQFAILTGPLFFRHVTGRSDNHAALRQLGLRGP